MIKSFLKYLQFEKRLSSNTVLAYQNDLLQLQSFSKENFHQEKLEALSFSELRAWLINLVEAGIEPVSINRKIASLRTFYKFLLREEVISKDPTMKIKVMKVRKKLPGFIKENEMQQVLDEAAQGPGSEFARLRNLLVLELFYATGIRLSELVNLEDQKVDLRNQTIKVLGKRNKERIIPFSRSLVDLIAQYRKLRNVEVGKKDHKFFFVTEKGKPCYPELISRIVKKFLRGTSSEKQSPHVLRHTFATHLLDKGAEINAVKDLLGHTSLAATQVYTHNSMDKLKKVFDQAHPKA